MIAQRGLDNARLDAGVKELTAQALSFVVVVTFVALIFGYLFALGITRPIRGLVESTRAMSRAEFHERVEVRGAAEIGELAETFNQMAGHIEQYVDKLRLAAEENHELFLGSIRMLAAAIDEKDPYTRGHSGPRGALFDDHRPRHGNERRGSGPAAHRGAAARRGKDRRR